MIHTVKGFCVVNKAEVDVFLGLSCFFDDPVDVGNLISFLCLFPVQLYKPQKSTNNKCWRGCEGKGSLLYYWWECKFVQPLWKTVSTFPKRSKLELPYDLTIPLLSIYLEETIIWKDICTPIFTEALFTIAKTWKQPKCPMADEWLKVWYIYTTEYHSVPKWMK